MYDNVEHLSISDTLIALFGNDAQGNANVHGRHTTHRVFPEEIGTLLRYFKSKSIFTVKDLMLSVCMQYHVLKMEFKQFITNNEGSYATQLVLDQAEWPSDSTKLLNTVIYHICIFITSAARKGTLHSNALNNVSSNDNISTASTTKGKDIETAEVSVSLLTRVSALMQVHKSISTHITSGSAQIDRLFCFSQHCLANNSITEDHMRGLERGYIYELFGESATGKTNLALQILCHTVSINTLHQAKQSCTTNYRCVYLVSEDTPNQTLVNMSSKLAEKYEFATPNMILQNIFIKKVSTLAEFETAIDNIVLLSDHTKALLHEHSIDKTMETPLVVIDSLASLIDRIAEMQPTYTKYAVVNAIFNKLHYCIKQLNAAILCINQVRSDICTGTLVPAYDYYIASRVHVRVHMSFTHDKLVDLVSTTATVVRRKMTLTKSPFQTTGNATLFYISAHGLTAVDSTI